MVKFFFCFKLDRTKDLFNPNGNNTSETNQCQCKEKMQQNAKPKGPAVVVTVDRCEMWVGWNQIVLIETCQNVQLKFNLCYNWKLDSSFASA